MCRSRSDKINGEDTLIPQSSCYVEEPKNNFNKIMLKSTLRCLLVYFVLIFNTDQTLHSIKPLEIYKRLV